MITTLPRRDGQRSALEAQTKAHMCALVAPPSPGQAVQSPGKGIELVLQIRIPSDDDDLELSLLVGVLILFVPAWLVASHSLAMDIPFPTSVHYNIPGKSLRRTRA